MSCCSSINAGQTQVSILIPVAPTFHLSYVHANYLADFDFTGYTALKNIYLNFNGTSTTRVAPELLSTVSCEVENIILRISSYELYDVGDWVQLDELLASLSPSLKVTVAIDEHGEYEEDIKTRLARCDIQGQLDIVHAGKQNITTKYVEEVYGRMKVGPVLSESDTVLQSNLPFLCRIFKPCLGGGGYLPMNIPRDLDEFGIDSLQV